MIVKRVRIQDGEVRALILLLVVYCVVYGAVKGLEVLVSSETASFVWSNSVGRRRLLV